MTTAQKNVKNTQTKGTGTRTTVSGNAKAKATIPKKKAAKKPAKARKVNATKAKATIPKKKKATKRAASVRKASSAKKA